MAKVNEDSTCTDGRGTVELTVLCQLKQCDSRCDHELCASTKEFTSNANVESMYQLIGVESRSTGVHCQMRKQFYKCSVT